MRIRITLVTIVILLGAASSAASQQSTKAADIPIGAFAQLPFMRDTELSPDGTHLAYIRPIKGRGHLIIQTMDGSGKPAVVPPSADVDID